MAVEDTKELQGTVLRIERGSIHDGTGLRTVIYLKGCPLRCWWCSTPEGQSFEIEEVSNNIYGEYMTVEDVMKEVRKDTAFYFHSGGGMTLSGGEILAQPQFAKELLKTSKKEGINTAIETSFFAPWPTINSILPYVDTAFVDIKLYDNAKHKKYCGVNNKRILDNLMKTNEVQYPINLIVRIPIIPGINDNKEELNNIGKFCTKLTNLRQVELLPYHRLGIDTYKKLGLEYKLKDIMPPSDKDMKKYRILLQQYIKDVI